MASLRHKHAARCLAWVLPVILAGTSGTGLAAEVTSDQVATSVRKAVAFLRTQHQQGHLRATGSHVQQGQVALAALAMLNAGVPANDPTVKDLVAQMDKVPNAYTYVVSLKCQLYAALDDPNTHGKKLQAAADWLVKNQNRTRNGMGMWTYRERTHGRGDNSNTQFALLGLHEAAQAGARVPDDVWLRSRKHWLSTQLNDGGWTYTWHASLRQARGRRSPSYGSMTAAGVASLYICGQRLHVAGQKQFVDGEYPNCGKYVQNTALAKGLEWLTKRFSVTENPGRRTSWLYYYLYALERVGMISGQRNFGKHDWYRKGAAQLVKTQNGNGSWGNARMAGRSSFQTSLAVLFLAKGNRPVLVQKLRWDNPKDANDWNRNIHDLENLTAYFGTETGQPVTWQTASLDLSVRELRASPILFVTGHTFPDFSAADRKKLRQYVDTGGTLLFEACCGKEAFTEGFKAFAKKTFPEYPLRPLNVQDHPVYRSHFQLTEDHGLMGIDAGCRTSVFFSPRALSCLWELEDIPKHSPRAFKIGTNIAAYATGREQLKDKLATVDLPAHRDGPDDDSAEVPRNAVRIARLIHDGEYNADPHAMVRLASLVRKKANVPVVAKARHLRASDENLYDYPVIFMTGHFSFKLSDADRTALRKYLDRGGFLMTSACCGRKAFDTSFRELVAQLYPDQKLSALPKTHPILSGQVGKPLGELAFRRILADELKKRSTDHPPLEVITVKGRTVLVYSKYDFCCALEGDNPYSCRGYADQDGQDLALNILLYAISY